MKRSAGTLRRSPIKRTDGGLERKPLRQVSKKKASDDRANKPDRDAYLAEHPYCEIGYALSQSDDGKALRWYRENCWGTGIVVHERQKRSSQGSLVDPVNLMACCPPCNGFVEDWPKIARDLGLVVYDTEDPAAVFVRRM